MSVLSSASQQQHCIFSTHPRYNMYLISLSESIEKRTKRTNFCLTKSFNVDNSDFQFACQLTGPACACAPNTKR
jgi:hypothetical protein